MPSRRRLAPSLVAAFALHAGIVALLGAVVPSYGPAAANPVIATSPALAYEVEIEAASPAAPALETGELARAMPPVQHPAERGVYGPQAHGGAEGPRGGETQSPEIVTGSDATGAQEGPWSISPKRKGSAAPAPVARVDLAVGPTLSWRLVDNPNKRRDPGVEQGEATAGGLRTALDEHDREIGLGRGGAILSQLQTAARVDSAPLEGKALLEVTVDTRGSVWVGVSQSNHPGWTKVASQLATQLRGGRFRIPPGARGLKFQVEVDARVVEYDGSKRPVPAKLELSKGKLGENNMLEKMPGLYLSGGGRICQYQVGVIPIPNQPLTVGGWCDPTKLVVGPTRMVSARVVGETRL